MITLDNAQLAFIQQQYGVEPTIVLAINFTDYFVLNNVSGATIYSDDDIDYLLTQASSTVKFFSDKIIYADDGVTVLFPGRITQISNINASVNYDGQNSTSDVTVTIDDNDMYILDLLGTYNIQKVSAFLYLYFTGMGVADMIPLFEGEIVSGFSWSDKDKSATFTILNHIEEKEVGYSPEQGYYPDLPAEMIGKPWPFGYGSIIKSKAILIDVAPVCVTTAPMGWHDPTLPNEIGRLYTIASQYYGIALLYYIGALEAIYSGLDPTPYYAVADQAVAVMSEVYTNQASLQAILAEQASYEDQQQVISNLQVNLSGTFFTGGALHPGTLKANFGGGQDLYGGSGVGILSLGMPLPVVGDSLLPYSSPSHREEFTFLQAGSSVRFLGPYPMHYIVNTIGGTVNGVYAYVNVDGANALVKVPKALYKVKKISTNPSGIKSTVPTFQALAIELASPLSSLPTAHYTDDLYVSFTSPIGPGLQSILNFLIHTYTQFTYDSESFNALPGFNCSFVKSDQIDVMQQIKEICFQCQVAVWLSEGKFYFKYLPNFIASPMQATLNDILADSVSIGITPTENIVTKIKAAWRTTYQYDTRNYLCIRYNDFRYGVHELDIDYYCFADPAQIMQSMMFWIYRKGNTWKRLKFSLRLEYIQLQLFDNLELQTDVVNLYRLGTPDNVINASVISMTLNTDTYMIDIELELPIYVGSMKNSPPYWMSGYGGAFYQIDENFDLTEKPQQTIAYLRGEQAANVDATVALQYELMHQFDPTSSTGPQLKLNQIDPTSGTFLPSAITGQDGSASQAVRMDIGGSVQLGYSGQTPAAPAYDKSFSTLIPPPGWDYNYVNYPPIQPPSDAQPGCCPGKIISVDSANAGNYLCLVYKQGTQLPGTQISATLLQDAQNDLPIPGGTWAIFSIVQGQNPDSDQASSDVTPSPNADGSYYYFQVPLWLG